MQRKSRATRMEQKRAGFARRGCEAMLRIRNLARSHDTGWEHREALFATRGEVWASNQTNRSLFPQQRN
jgi:hypothetical protein